MARQREDASSKNLSERSMCARLWRARHWRRCLFGVAASVGLHTTSVHAQVPGSSQTSPVAVAEQPEPREAGSNLSATELFWQGNDAFSGARYAEAIDRYTRAYALSQEPALLFNVAQSQRQLGDCHAARDAYAKYRALEPNPPQAAIQWAAEPDNACTQSPGSSSAPVGEPAAVGTTPVQSPVLEATPQTTAKSESGLAAPIGREPPRESNTKTRRIVAWSLIGAGAACAGVATWAAIAADRAQDDADREAQKLIGSDTPWDAQGEALQQGADDKRALALGFGIGAGALVAAGVVLHLIQPDAGEHTTNRLAGFNASLSPSLAALGYGGAF